MCNGRGELQGAKVDCFRTHQEESSEQQLHQEKKSKKKEFNIQKAFCEENKTNLNLIEKNMKCEPVCVNSYW
eukprot:NODE_842_length_585_cov_320.189956_g832_i0.p1 GENE.NODE_842_length_585_cov_320.189956_g832_i0~~NODE_842_length_585_cov_320.189956_g832_i0.p1  ORF type:complete len:72 (+),score=19.71 NODE_842_length_585_cov_320.189956_g832_i0:296-511(+)